MLSRQPSSSYYVSALFIFGCRNSPSSQTTLKVGMASVYFSKMLKADEFLFPWRPDEECMFLWVQDLTILLGQILQIHHGNRQFPSTSRYSPCAHVVDTALA